MLDAAGNDESGYLNQLEEITRSGKNQAKKMLSIWNNGSDENLKHIYEKYSY
jgi:gamma-glutamylcysteine synthetase